MKYLSVTILFLLTACSTDVSDLKEQLQHQQEQIIGLHQYTDRLRNAQEILQDSIKIKLQQHAEALREVAESNDRVQEQMLENARLTSRLMELRGY